MTTQGLSAHQILDAIWYRNYSVVSADNYWLSDHLVSEFGFSMHEYASQRELNHWKIPQDVVPMSATIKDSRGKLLFDAADLPLALPPLCPDVNKKVLGKKITFYVMLLIVWQVIATADIWPNTIFPSPVEVIEDLHTVLQMVVCFMV